MSKNGVKAQRKPQRRAASSPRHAEIPEDSPALWWKHLKKSLVITLLAGIVLLLAAALSAYFLPDPYPWIRPFSIAASMLTAAVGGFACARIHRHAALLCGLLNGSAFMLGMLLGSLLLKPYAAGYSTGVSLLLHLEFLLCSVLGAFWGLRRKSPAKRR